MKIESKFNARDRIYWIENNKIRRAYVMAIHFPTIQIVKYKGVVKKECTYSVSIENNSMARYWLGGKLKESVLFSSKTKALKSILS